MRILAIATLGLLTALALALPAQAAADPCNHQVTGNHSTGVYTKGCAAYVSADAIDCLWGEHWNTYSAGPVTVRHTSCNDPADGS
jgi:hypothetical protein